MRLKLSQQLSKLVSSISTTVKSKQETKVESKEDLPQVKEYKSPDLLELLQDAAASGDRISILWATKNLIIIYDPDTENGILFDVKKNKRCKSLDEQLSSTDTPLYQSMVDYLKSRKDIGPEEVKKASESDILSRVRHKFLPIGGRIFAAGRYQFFTIDEREIFLWDTSSSDQIQLVKTFKTPISSEDLGKIPGYSRRRLRFDKTPWYFQPQVFPDKSHIMVIYGKKHNFMDLKTGEKFTVTLGDHWDTTSIINNHQLVLSKSINGCQSYLLTIDFKEKMAKLHKDRPVIDEYQKNPKGREILLNYQVILELDEENDFEGFEISPNGALISIPSLKGNAGAQNIRLDKGEFVYWDNKKKEVRMIDPFARRIITLLKADSVTSLYSNGNEIFVLTPKKLFHCIIPDCQQRIAHAIDKHLSIPGINDMVMDYVGFKRDDNPHLLSKLSFLTISKDENQAIPFETEVKVQNKLG